MKRIVKLKNDESISPLNNNQVALLEEFVGKGDQALLHFYSSDEEGEQEEGDAGSRFVLAPMKVRIPKLIDGRSDEFSHALHNLDRWLFATLVPNEKKQRLSLPVMESKIHEKQVAKPGALKRCVKVQVNQLAKYGKLLNDEAKKGLQAASNNSLMVDDNDE